MTWKDLLTRPECARSGCRAEKASGESYCLRHAKEQRERQKKAMAKARRLAPFRWKQVPLFTG